MTLGITPLNRNVKPQNRNVRLKGRDRMKSKLKDGAHCVVVAGTHKGKSGTVRDINTSKTGQVTVTVVQNGGERFKTLARNVQEEVALLHDIRTAEGQIEAGQVASHSVASRRLKACLLK